MTADAPTTPTPLGDLADRLAGILDTVRDLTAKMEAVLPSASTDRE
ncbi:hypothetical protein [Micromonospora rubida]